MKKLTNNGRGQLSLEAAIVMIFFIMLIQGLWFAGPAQQSVEKSTDFNAIMLAEKSLDNIAEEVKATGMGGIGEKRDFTIHVPQNTVSIAYEQSSQTISMTVLLLSDPGISASVPQYTVGGTGRPLFIGGGTETPFYYTTITKRLDFPLEKASFPLCNSTVMKDSTEVRGASTLLKDVDGNPIKLCCESGFNLRLYTTKWFLDDPTIELKGRHYYSSDYVPDWTIL